MGARRKDHLLYGPRGFSGRCRRVTSAQTIDCSRPRILPALLSRWHSVTTIVGRQNRLPTHYLGGARRRHRSARNNDRTHRISRPLLRRVVPRRSLLLLQYRPQRNRPNMGTIAKEIVLVGKASRACRPNIRSSQLFHRHAKPHLEQTPGNRNRTASRTCSLRFLFATICSVSIRHFRWRSGILS